VADLRLWRGSSRRPADGRGGSTPWMPGNGPRALHLARAQRPPGQDRPRRTSRPELRRTRAARGLSGLPVQTGHGPGWTSDFFGARTSRVAEGGLAQRCRTFYFCSRLEGRGGRPAGVECMAVRLAQEHLEKGPGVSFSRTRSSRTMAGDRTERHKKIRFDLGRIRCIARRGRRRGLSRLGPSRGGGLAPCEIVHPSASARLPFP